ncbi:MAG: HlyU family transcriptional regulator [Rhizobiaceae bacterium]
MSILKWLFGGKSSAAEELQASVEHEGYTITPSPINEGGQYRLCGVISKNIDGELREHRLIRADLLPSINEANEFTIRKAKQAINEQGDRIFST